MNADTIKELGYFCPRQLPNGDWIAGMRFIFTWGVVVGINEQGYKRRFCYRDINDALKCIANWDGEGDPPGMWIKEKGPNGDRRGPGADPEPWRNNTA